MTNPPSRVASNTPKSGVASAQVRFQSARAGDKIINDFKSLCARPEVRNEGRFEFRPGPLELADPARSDPRGTPEVLSAVGSDSDSRRSGAGLDPETHLADLPILDAWVRAQHHAVAEAAVCGEVATPRALPSDLEQLLGRLVRRAAWGGDRQRGTARIELGSGELAGATLTVSAEGSEVSVELELPPGIAPEPWQQRIRERLTERGLSAQVHAR